MWYFTYNSSHLIPVLWKYPLIFFFLWIGKLLRTRTSCTMELCVSWKQLLLLILFWTFQVSVSFYIHHFFHLGRQFTVLFSTWLTQISLIKVQSRLHQFDAPVWFSLLPHKSLTFPLYPFIYTYIHLQMFVNHLSLRTVDFIQHFIINLSLT